MSFQKPLHLIVKLNLKLIFINNLDLSNNPNNKSSSESGKYNTNI